MAEMVCGRNVLWPKRLESNGGGYYFLLFIVPLNPFGIKFMSKNRFDCVCFINRVVNKLPLMLRIYTKNTFLVLVRVFN